MTEIKINEQIAFLRKQKGLTQEDLANALGVTNQAVSKWESAQCCPDIQLLPAIAKLFGVPAERVKDCLEGELAPFILEKESAESEFRFDGMYMNILPILSLIDLK